ncbi:hypothetical protein [Bradyrhizobium sp. MOS002]|uniref:hypothetical protein n=1 Tax=Bradyrhizobium sp. MOS002 TaxID=2133947 RepID=UPI000D13E2FF|nr:hypothetical protein [Bradyrhizobium sp. MOS002]PSO29843.1 hypothetical protein C7G41_24170 [Bradyrhizobium sp. MOS002]
MVIGVDARSKHGRRFRDLVTAYTDEIGGRLTASDQAMVKQAAALAVRAEMAQAQIINGHEVNVDDMVRLCSESRRLIDNLKGKAAARKPEAEPDLADYLKGATAAA